MPSSEGGEKCVLARGGGGGWICCLHNLLDAGPNCNLASQYTCIRRGPVRVVISSVVGLSKSVISRERSDRVLIQVNGIHAIIMMITSAIGLPFLR